MTKLEQNKLVHAIACRGRVKRSVTMTLAAQIMKRPDILARLHLVEALLVLGIILVSASIFLRVAYGPEMLSLEDRSMESLGIPKKWDMHVPFDRS